MNVSVVQGSKLSGILYTIYTAEIPKLTDIMHNEELYKQMTGVTLPVFKNIEHKTTNFVDDSTSVVGAETKAELEQYVQHFYYLLVAYYKINKLKMNGYKSKMIIINDKDNPISISTVKS